MTTRREFLKVSAQLPAAAMAASGFNLFVPRAHAAALLPVENETIQGARNVALSILKPTPKDIDRGLRLHAESLVFDAYGFAPRCAIDADALNAAMKAGASDEELTDLREEMATTRCVHDERERREFFDAFRAAGVTAVFQNAGEESNDPLRLLKRLARFTFTTDLLARDLRKAVAVDDIPAAKRDNVHCLCLTANGVPLRQRWESTRDELTLIRLFSQLGIRMMHATYNRRNPIGDGAGEPHDGGLSDFGRQVVRELNQLGVIVDVAHSGWRTSRESAQASSRPMVASHTACCGVHSHFRGKPDDVIKAVCDTGGLIGICCIPAFLGGTGDISAFLDHIDYAVRRFGSEHVAIGTDVAYVSRQDRVEQSRVLPAGPRSRPARWEHLWPADPSSASPRGLQSLAWTNWPLFTVGLVQRGHSDETIRRILGENMRRVLRANWPHVRK